MELCPQCCGEGEDSPIAFNPCDMCGGSGLIEHDSAYEDDDDQYYPDEYSYD